MKILINQNMLKRYNFLKRSWTAFKQMLKLEWNNFEIIVNLNWNPTATRLPL